MLRRKRSQNGEGGVTDRFAFVRFVVRAAQSLERGPRDDPYGDGIVGGPGVIDRRMKDSEKPRTDRRLPGHFLRIRQRLVEPLGHNRGGACRRGRITRIRPKATHKRALINVSSPGDARPGPSPACLALAKPDFSAATW